MISFRLGKIPVHVHALHLLISAAISWTFMSWKGPTNWPSEILSNENHPRYTATVVIVTLSWMMLVSLSVMVHELGHATVAQLFGAKPVIQLVGLGGLTRGEGLDRFEWWKDVLFTLAGPAAGLALGVGAGLLVVIGGTSIPEPVRYFATGVFYANLFWAILNLLPISTLDGGRITAVVLTHLMGRPGFLVAQFIALALAAGIMLLAAMSQQLILAILVVLMVMRTFANISAYRRGELPRGHVAHPLEAVIEHAETLYRQRKLSEAASVARGIAEAGVTPPLLRSRAQVLLGWVALKEGEGRRALDHFSQVQGLEVPPQALAAGFSLVGDEVRAIPLWAQAARITGEPVVLHEFAGALIRAGREAEARQLVGIRMARAFSAAERVHYVRKEFEQAALAAEAAFQEEPSSTLAYTAACAWAQARKPEHAIRFLTLAAQNGYRNVTEARTDPDLQSLRSRPEFENWLASLAQSSPS